MDTTVHGRAGQRNRGQDFAGLVASVGLDLVRLAASTGLGLVTLYSLRNGNKRPRRSTLVAVAHSLDAARVAAGSAVAPITVDVVEAAVRRSQPRRRKGAA